MKTVKAQYRASYTDYDGLDTFRVMPTKVVSLETIEPFIFLNHHGPQAYAPGNTGLPFGPHPHKGFETVTFILEGDVAHTDSSGHTSTITAGGIQWMTAGRGIIHSENSSEQFKKQGGIVNILQLWINLPAKFKNADPAYIGLQKEEVPLHLFNEGKVKVHLVSGNFQNQPAPIQSLSGVNLSWIEFQPKGNISIDVPADDSVLLYIIKGKLLINGEASETHELLEFNRDGESISFDALEDSIILFGHVKPNREPIVAHGPFVMNTQQEITQAFLEYQQGKFGEWK